MTQTAMKTPEPQRLRALERANEIRLARAALKRSIARASLRRGGHSRLSRCRIQLAGWRAAYEPAALGQYEMLQVLSRNQIGETKPVGALTDRQRQVLAVSLDASISRGMVLVGA